jgi:pentapeptide MXKDX repeat protein
MNKILAGVLTVGIILSGAQAFAGDTQTNPPPSKDQTMKDCMSRMAEKNDGTTKENMKKACKAEMNNSMNKDAMGKDDNTTMPKPQ